MIHLFSSIESNQVKSITPDRGKEFSKHWEITKALNNVPFYFPDPHAPWQRKIQRKHLRPIKRVFTENKRDGYRTLDSGCGSNMFVNSTYAQGSV